MGSLHIRRP